MMDKVEIQKKKGEGENCDWGKMPQSLLGWVLYHFSPKGRKRVVILITIVAVAVLILSYILLFFRENLEIRKLIKEEQLKYWKRSDDPAWKSALLNIWNKPGDVPQEIWEKASKEKDPQILIAVASHPWVLNDLKEKLITEGTDVRVRIAGILNRVKRDEAIAMLAGDEDYGVRFVVAKCPQTPRGILDELAKDAGNRIHRDAASKKSRELSNDEVLLSFVASNPNTPSGILRTISEDKTKHEILLSFVASNPRTPEDILIKLAGHPDGAIRLAVGENQSTPTETLGFLAGDDYYVVRRAVAANPNTPIGILQKWAKIDDPHIKRAVATNPNTPIDILQEWLKVGEPQLRSEVALNTNISPGMLAELAEESNTKILQAVALNPRTEPEVLRELSSMKTEMVQSAVSGNPNTPVDILKTLATDRDRYIRAKVAGNSSTPPDVLEALSKDSNVEVVEAVAGNPSTPFKILRRLAVDRNRKIRENALLTIISQPEDRWRP
jgi:Ni,Fe-hydrogenase III small subunit